MSAAGKASAIKAVIETDTLETPPAGQEKLPVVVPRPTITSAATSEPKRSWWKWALGGLVASGLATLMYLQPWATQTVAVVVETVAPGPVTRVLAVNGRIAGVRSVDVQPLVSGALVEVLVAEGDKVIPDQELMLLDTTAQQALVRQAMAGLDAAIVAQEEALATLARTRALGENEARVVLENATRAEQTAAQEVERMTALLEQAEILLGKFTIRAPIAGTVLVLNADPGQSVDPATVLLTIADLGQLVVETDVDESYATQVRTGQPAALQLSGEDVVRAGHVSFVSQRVDTDTGGLAVKLTPDEALVAPIGLTVTANISVDDRAAAITVPRAAIVRDATGDAVLLVRDDKASRRAVKVIDWPAARLIVTDGLVAGDLVISDATGLADGQAVKVSP